jgi:hypothetical protein
MRKVTLTLLVLAALALSSALGEEAAARADPPAEVQALIDRNAHCNSLATHPEPNSAAQLDAQRLYILNATPSRRMWPCSASAIKAILVSWRRLI